MPKPKLPRKPRPLRLPEWNDDIAHVEHVRAWGVARIWIAPHFWPRSLGVKNAARTAAWFAEAHAYIAAVEARREARHG